MKSVRRGIIWLFMIWKRMFKKPGYLLLLLAIAALAASISLFSENAGELVRVAVYASDEDAQMVLWESQKNTTIIKYDFFDSEKAALDAVEVQGFDAAWIFDGSLEKASLEFAKRGTPIVRVLQREDTVFLRLAREKLYATIYPYISKAVYDRFMGDNFPEADREVTDQYYYSQSEARAIVEIKFNNSDQGVDDLNLLASPVRGILAVAVFLCAYAALMSFKKDRDGGLFARSPEGRLVYIEGAYIFVSVLNAGLLTLVSMYLTGIFTTLGTEVLLMVVYMLLCTVCCVVLGELTESIGALGALMPILTLVMLVLCPVFIHLIDVPQIQLLLPPFYYLSALRSMDYVLYSLVYVLGGAAIYALLKGIKHLLLKVK